jgi:hypothetical protein
MDVDDEVDRAIAVARFFRRRADAAEPPPPDGGGSGGEGVGAGASDELVARCVLVDMEPKVNLTARQCQCVCVCVCVFVLHDSVCSVTASVMSGKSLSCVYVCLYGCLCLWLCCSVWLCVHCCGVEIQARCPLQVVTASIAAAAATRTWAYDGARVCIAQVHALAHSRRSRMCVCVFVCPSCGAQWSQGVSLAIWLSLMFTTVLLWCVHIFFSCVYCTPLSNTGGLVFVCAGRSV